jgi:glutathione synthase/RimK-type ligase-like ATP-grasp enzyme
VTPYPNQTRFVARACAQLGYRFTDLDDGGGYLFSVSDGLHEFVSGSGLIGTYPLNTAPAYCVSRDKFHTHVVLERTGLPTIASQLFFVRDDNARLRGPGRERGDAEAAFARAEKPLFCKPNQGSRGDFAEIVHDDAGFDDYLMRVAARYDAILLQPLLTGDEYRVFTIDGDAIFATRKSELRLVGDGHSSLRQLLRMHNRQFDRSGVSPLTEENALAAIASREGVRGEDIPAAGRAVAIPGRRNLSAGGDVESFTTDVPPPLADIALRAARAIGLRVAGIDIFDISPRRDLSALTIIEVNGNPAIASLEAIGRSDVVDRIWTTILARSFAELRLSPALP